MAEKLEQPSTPTLHHLQSSQSMRVLWALEEVAEADLYKTDFKYNLKIYKRMYGPNPELTKIFPLGKSPIMTIEEKNGAPPKVYQLEQYPGVLTESTLLLDFVNTTYANRMWDPATEEDARGAKFFDTLAHNTLSVNIVSALLFEVIPAMLPWGLSHLVGYMVWPMVSYWKKNMQPVFKVMEESLDDTKPSFAGQQLGLADFDMSWCLDVASQRSYFDPVKYPKIKAWHDKVQARPAYQRAREKGGVYDLKTFGIGTSDLVGTRHDIPK